MTNKTGSVINKIKKLAIIILPLFILVLGISTKYFGRTPPVDTKFVQNVKEEPRFEENQEPVKDIEDKPYKEPSDSVEIKLNKHIYQTFNNCGPATLSMILSHYGVDVSQAELGKKMRPYQHPGGDNDDKTIFTHEFVSWAEHNGLDALERVNGDINTLKYFTTNGFPVVVKTWLEPKDDIGHFRIVKGFDDQKQIILQDDSYQGPNKKYSYYDFLSLWQPFNYAYIIVYPQEKKDLVNAILGSETDKGIAYKNAVLRAEQEHELDPENPYPMFNLATSHYHLENYENSIMYFELVKTRLPRRMLWYQIEPILSYQKLRKYETVFDITNYILENGNRAFSELYLIQGEIYLDQNEIQKARESFTLALKYNEYFEDAVNALAGIE